MMGRLTFNKDTPINCSNNEKNQVNSNYEFLSDNTENY